MAEYKIEGPRLKSDIKRETIKPEKDVTSWIVLASIIVVLVLVFSFIIYLIRKDTNFTEVINQCDAGLCAFNTTTGIKNCPSSNTGNVSFTPEAEFCTSRNYCQSKNYTCAVQSDQTLDCSGVCGTGNDQCRCIKDPTIQ